jgi:dolichyl-phosphate-mannose--protein O-mannosyl transferase
VEDAWFNQSAADDGLVARVAEVAAAHQRMADFHRDLTPENPYSGPAWTWPINADATLLWAGACHEQPSCPATPAHRQVIIALANPILWVAGLAAVGSATVCGFKRRGRSAIIAGFAGVMLVPWLLSDRAAYNFYGAALVPVLVIAITTEAGAARTRRITSLAVAALLLFAAWYPYTAGLYVPSDYTRTVLPGFMQP